MWESRGTPKTYADNYVHNYAQLVSPTNIHLRIFVCMSDVIIILKMAESQQFIAEKFNSIFVIKAYVCADNMLPHRVANMCVCDNQCVI